MYPKLAQSSRCYRFNGFEADTQIGTLSHKGERVPLQELPFQLLTVLLQRPGELVSRENLREELWPPGVHVDYEVSLATAVKKLRQALGDTAREPRYIETHPGRGYRFLQPVEIVRDPPPPGPHPLAATAPAASGGQNHLIPLRGGPTLHAEEPLAKPSRRPHLKWVAAGLTLALAGGAVVLGKPWHGHSTAARSDHLPSLVALPTRVLGEREASYLADAIPDTLTTLFAGVGGLETRFPPTSLELEKVGGDLEKAAEAYRVDSLLLSTVTVQGERLLLNLQLVEPGTRKVRWSGQFAGLREGYADLLRQAAAAVVQTLLPVAAAAPSLGDPALGSDADLALQKGLAFKREWQNTQNPGLYGEALKAFQVAGRLAPSSPVPLVEEASLLRTRYYQTQDESLLREAEAALARALELDPRSGLGWCVASDIELSRPVGNPDRIIDAVFKAAAYAPEHHRSMNLLAAVAPTSSIQAAVGLHALEARPLAQSGYWNAAMGLMGAGRAGEALPVLDRSLRIWPRWDFGKQLRLEALFRLGRWEEAPALAPDQPSPLVEVRLSIMRGDLSEARRKALATVTGWREESTPRGGMDWTNRAYNWTSLLVRLELKDDALWLLERMIDAKVNAPVDYLLLDPELHPLRTDPRFARIAAEARAMARPFLAQATAAEARNELPPYLKAPVAELRGLLTPLQAPAP